MVRRAPRMFHDCPPNHVIEVLGVDRDGGCELRLGSRDTHYSRPAADHRCDMNRQTRTTADLQTKGAVGGRGDSAALVRVIDCEAVREHHPMTQDAKDER